MSEKSVWLQRDTEPVESETVRAAQAGDSSAFDQVVRPLRTELHAHCYRMLGSTHDADDALQDALVRAWNGMSSFEARGSFRSWLYTVATRSCLDVARTRRTRALPIDLGPASEHPMIDDRPRTDVDWLSPYPDADLGPAMGGPPTSLEGRYERREAVEIAFVAALQHLPSNQRAALVLFEVVGFSAAEIAATMKTSVASVNSALQRARAVVAERVPSPTQQQALRTIGDTRTRAIASGFAVALEQGSTEALVALLAEDVSWSMPPLPHWYRGLPSVKDFANQVPFRCGSWQYRILGANGQPAVAFYLGENSADCHRAWSITVLTLRRDRIVAITSFLGAEHFQTFGLPDSVSGKDPDVHVSGSESLPSGGPGLRPNAETPPDLEGDSPGDGNSDPTVTG